MQPPFLISMILGGIIMLIGPVLGIGEFSFVTCTISFVVFYFGFTLFFLSNIIRLWKIVNLIEAAYNSLMIVTITPKQLGIRLLFVVTINIIILTLCVILAPVEVSQSYTVVETNTVSGIKETITHSFQCQVVCHFLFAKYQYFLLYHRDVRCIF